MSSDNKDEEAAAAAKPAKRSRLGLILAVVGMLVSAGGGIGGALFLTRSPAHAAEGERQHGDAETEGEGGGEGAAEEAEGGDEGHGGEGDEGEGHSKRHTPHGPMVALDPLLVNVRDGEGSRYLKVGASIELGRNGTAEELSPYVPVIRNEALGYLRGLTVEEIGAPDALTKVRKSLRTRIRTVVGRQLVRDVFLTEFVTQ